MRTGSQWGTKPPSIYMKARGEDDAAAMTGKRIVFIHPDGLFQIMGTDDGMAKLPVVAEEFEAGGRLVEFASLVRVTPRAAYYKEPMEPGVSYTFDERQK